MNRIFVGADVSKKTVDFSVVADGIRHHLKAENREAGFAALLEWLDGLGIQEPHLVCEATGIYYIGLARYFFERGLPVSVVNPYQIALFAQSQFNRTKTDKQDAAVISDFAASRSATSKPLPLWQPSSEAVDEITDFYRLLEQLTNALTAEKNRIHTARDSVKPFHQANISHLKQQIAFVREKLNEAVSKDVQIKETALRLQTVPGIGSKTAALLTSVLHGRIRFTSVEAFIAYCGLAPRQFQSGTSVNKIRKDRYGRPELKKSLFMPALRLYGMGVFAKFVERLKKRNKKPKTIIGALMRKLAVIAFNLYKKQEDFKPERYA